MVPEDDSALEAKIDLLVETNNSWIKEVTDIGKIVKQVETSNKELLEEIVDIGRIIRRLRDKIDKIEQRARYI
jgi:predicted RNase H-like nuclease (RuvC/YqgF family)